MFSSHCLIVDLTDEQWVVISPLIPDPPRRPDGKGRPWKDPRRDVMNGILWILRTGAPWYDMPDRYPPYQTCHRRRFQQWVRTGGLFEQVLRALATDLHERGGLDLSECYIDGGTFIVANKGGTKLERLSGANVRRRSWQYQIVLMVFLSPYTLRLLLRRMKSPPLLNRLSPSVLSLMKNQNTL
jgi:transposase